MSIIDLKLILSMVEIFRQCYDCDYSTSINNMKMKLIEWIFTNYYEKLSNF